MTLNADNNQTMALALPQYLPGFKGPWACVRCFAHILNLVVKVSYICPLLAHSLTSTCSSRQSSLHCGQDQKRQAHR
ncbi:hypothetical protein K439DRAFT_1339095 [Ramaria rubella]|nr:hypothetical protein K439DRAFT_1339095 [Ramaria rubella]